MTLNDYQKAAERTSGNLTSWDKIRNGCYGLNGEAGELYRHSESGLFADGISLPDPSKWEYNPHTLLKGHGEKSVMLLSQFYTLTEEEICCIRYHMGAFTPKEEWNDYTGAIHAYPNVLWTHHADMLASHVAGV